MLHNDQHLTLNWTGLSHPHSTSQSMSGTQSQPLVSVSILETKLRLLRLPKSQLEPCAFHLIRTLWFRSSRPAAQKFFSLTCNTLEVSLFADSELVQELYEGLGEASQAEISEHDWVALQVESHDEEPFEDSGKRVRDLAAPLAENGISIMFKSTYFSDFLLVKVARLQRVCEILQETSGFTFHASDDSDDGLQSPTGTDWSTSSGYHPFRPTPMTRSITGSLLLDKSPTKLQESALDQPKIPAARTFNAFHRKESQASDDLPVEAPSAEVTPIENDDAGEAVASSSPLEESDDGAHDEALAQSVQSDNSLHITSSLYLLPDELVCIGLDMPMEKIWREKLVKALFYSADILDASSSAEEDSDSLSGRNLSSDPAQSGSRARRRKSRTYQTFAEESQSPTAKPSPTAPTAMQDSPVPFFSFTGTSDNASLVLDVRLLRLLFTEEEAAMTFTVGGDGVAGPFRGETGVESQSSSSTEKRGRQGRASDGEDWTRVGTPENIETGRQIMKCLQLDLSSFGLDKKGIVNLVGETLSAGSVKNMLYSSTYSTACVLVSKDEIELAQAALERLS